MRQTKLIEWFAVHSLLNIIYIGFVPWTWGYGITSCYWLFVLVDLEQRLVCERAS